MILCQHWCGVNDGVWKDEQHRYGWLYCIWGAARSNFMKLLLACWADQTIQATVLAYTGHFRLSSLLRFLGILSGI